MHSWRVLLLPYLEQGRLYDQYNFSEPWDGPNNHRLAAKMPAVYALHGDYQPGLTATNYLAVVGPETAWPGQKSLASEDVTDDSASTILVVENRGADVPWMAPQDLTFSAMPLEINHPEGVSSKYVEPAVAMLDGELHRLRPDLSPDALRALLTVAGGEDIQQYNGQWTLLPDGRDRPLVP